MGLFVQQIINGIIIGGIYAVIAIGLTLIFGVMKISNFAHGDYSMVGAYVAVFLASWISGWYGWVSSILFAAALVGILGVVTERFVFRPLSSRRTDIDTIMVSIGLFIVLENLALLFFGATPHIINDPFKNSTINFGLFSTSVLRVFCFVFSCISIMFLQFVLNRTKTGIAIRATSQNSKVALLMGVNIGMIYMLTFAIGAAMAGIGGVMYGTLFAVFPMMGAVPTLKAFVVTILGGMGSVRGAIFGGVILGVAETLGGSFISMQYKNSIGFIIIILVLLIKPHGLFGKKEIV